jgi:hypothetical protein
MRAHTFGWLSAIWTGAMPHLPSPSIENGSARERMDRLRVGMEVHDAAGQILGKVTFIYKGDQGVTGDGIRVSSKEQGLTAPKGEERDSDEQAGLAGMLQSGGYIKIRHEQRLHWTHYFYASAGEIVSIDASTVHLNALSRDLISSLE